MATTYHTELQKLYVAYFTRPADPKGLEYWETAAEAAGGDLTAISAAFATSAEYKAAYDGKTNEEVIDQIYQNLFGRPAEAAGKAYWAQQITNKALTIDQAVKIIGDAALTTDKVAFTNKVKAAEAFTGALDTPAEIAGYAGEDALVLAREFVAGVTTDATYAAAVTPANLATVINEVVHAGTPFTLATALASLDAANDALADFLKEADVDDDADTVETPTTIANAVEDAKDAIIAIVPDYDDERPAVQAAVLAAQQQENTLALAAAESDYAKAVAAANKVAGLSDAITAQATADEANTAAIDAKADAVVAVSAAEVAYEGYNTATITIADDGTVAGLIELKDGELVLVDKVTEKANKGITALLNSIIAREEAEVAADAAAAALYDAKVTVEATDLADPKDANLIAVGQKISLTADLDVGVVPTAEQVTDELGALRAAVDAAEAGSPEADAAQDALDEFVALVDTFTGANATTLSDDVATADEAVDAANEVIEALNDAVTALNEVQAVATELAGLEEAVTFAKDTFTINDYKLPVTLGASASATSGSDIYLVTDEAASKISNFGAGGDDILYVGSGYKLNTTGDATKGVNADLEVFFVKSGTGTKVVVETSAFGSNASTPEILEITLTGVAPTELKFENGIITHV